MLRRWRESGGAIALERGTLPTKRLVAGYHRGLHEWPESSLEARDRFAEAKSQPSLDMAAGSWRFRCALNMNRNLPTRAQTKGGAAGPRERARRAGAVR